MNKKFYIYIAGTALCTLLFCISIFHVISHYADANKSTNEFAQLVEIVEQAEEAEEIKESDKAPEETAEGENQSPLGKYQELFNQNNEMAGWISIDDTNISYPVMYTPDNPDFYLKRGFDKKDSAYGVPYIAEHCNPFLPSDNVIIYGHHMKNGTMFTGLMEYESRKFYENHKIIHFDTLTRAADYEIIAVFKTTVYDDTGYKYYLFADAENEEDFQEYVEGCKALSLYDTGVTAEYGDKLLTLSTCEYSRTNGRLVVVAKRITE